MLQTFAGRCIHHSKSGIRVMDNGLYRWLMFESQAIQTLLFKPAPHTRGLRYIEALTLMAKALPGHSCLLGLGGAGAAHALSHSPGEHTLTVVELNAEVIDIARDYFQANDIDNMTIVHAEAAAYLQSCQTSFDHILVDLFDAWQFPEHCNNSEFLSLCKQRLHPEGVLAINLANSQDHLPMFQLFRDLFPRTTITIPVTGRENMVILACNTDGFEKYVDIMKKHRKIKQLHWNPDWGCVAELK